MSDIQNTLAQLIRVIRCGDGDFAGGLIGTDSIQKIVKVDGFYAAVDGEKIEPHGIGPHVQATCVSQCKIL